MPSSIMTQLVIPAPPEKVWAVLSDFNDWQWSSFISFPEPPTAVGKHFKVQVTAADGKVNTFTPVVLKLDHNKELRWQGKLWGSNLFFVGEHVFKLEPTPEGHTHLEHSERFKGCLVPLLGGMLAKTEVEFNKTNQQLSDRVLGRS